MNWGGGCSGGGLWCVCVRVHVAMLQQAQGAVLHVLGIHWRLRRLWWTEFGQNSMFSQVCGGFFFQKLQPYHTIPYKDIRTSMGSTRRVLHDGANVVFVTRINQRFSSSSILHPSFFGASQAPKNAVAQGKRYCKTYLFNVYVENSLKLYVCKAYNLIIRRFFIYI